MWIIKLWKKKNTLKFGNQNRGNQKKRKNKLQDEIASLKLVEQKNILDNFQFHRKINIQNKLLDMYAGEEMYLAGFNRVFSVFFAPW